MEQNTESNTLDATIERALMRDAESFRARFSTTPNETLTAKLAMQTASRGMLRTLGAKLAIYGGALAIAAAAFYFWPRAAVVTTVPMAVPVPAPVTQQSVPQPAHASPAAAIPERVSHADISHVKASSVSALEPDARSQPNASHAADSAPRVPKIRDQHYH